MPRAVSSSTATVPIPPSSVVGFFLTLSLFRIRFPCPVSRKKIARIAQYGAKVDDSFDLARRPQDQRRAYPSSDKNAQGEPARQPDTNLYVEGILDRQSPSSTMIDYYLLASVER